MQFYLLHGVIFSAKNKIIMNKDQLLLLTLFLFSLIKSYTQTIEVAGELTQNTYWNADTIILTDHLLVVDSVSLIIAEGTTVLAYEQKYLEIRGSLIAKGSTELPILFSAFDTLGFSDTTTVNGSWGGIHFINLNGQQDSSILDYCIIEYGGAFGEEELEQSGGGIFIDQSSKIRISNSVIQNNFAQQSGGGIFLYENSTTNIFNNLIQNNKTGWEGGGIMSMENSFPYIENNIIINNIALIYYEALPNIWTYTGRGGGILITTLSDASIPIVKSNIICNNYSLTGAGVYEASFNTEVVSNIICNNRGSGINTGNSISRSYYVNNTIVNNRGEGIRTFSPNINIFNNIVHDNFFYLGGNLIDTFDIRYKEGTPSVNFQYNNAGTATELEDHTADEDLTGFGNGNINVPPQFVNPSQGHGLAYNGYEADWSLVTGDASIDGGTTENILEMLPIKDAYGNDRILGETIDIGAVEFDRISVVNEGFDNDQINVYPNPFSGQIWIEVKDYQGEVWYLSVWNEYGQILHSFEVQHQISSINSSSWPSGIYFVEGKSKDGERVFIRKIMKGR